MSRSKLFRNLKAGDKFEVSIETPRFQAKSIVVVSRVEKCIGFSFGQKGYRVYGNFPFYWGKNYIWVNSKEKTDLI